MNRFNQILLSVSLILGIIIMADFLFKKVGDLVIEQAGTKATVSQQLPQLINQFNQRLQKLEQEGVKK